MSKSIHNPTSRWAPFLVATCLATSCATTGNDPLPAVAVPRHWQTETAQASQAVLSETWWHDLGSRELDNLVEQALHANRDLQIAAARVTQARALAAETDSDQSPQLNAVAGASKGRKTIVDPKATILHAGLQASWEADLFGQKDLASRAAQLDAESAELLRQGSATIVVAETTTAYLDAAILSRREDLAHQRLAVLTQAIATAEKQFAAGRATRLDINRAKLAYRTYAVEREQLHSALQQRLLQLTVLLGSTPGSVTPSFADFDKIHFSQPAPWLPGELLERRPDVRRQANEVAAAAARLGIAKRDIYPKFIFSWSDLHEKSRVTGQDAATNVALGYGISVTLPILDGGRIRSRIKVNEARLQESMAAYEKAMIEALANAETVLVRQNAQAANLSELKQAETLSQATLADARRLFDAGRLDKAAILDSQQALLQAQDSRLQAQGAYWIAGVDVYRAFSGRPTPP
jgi:outer membrane protein, multidrug efflux system